VVLTTVLFALLLQQAPAPAAAARLSRAETVRCAGLTQAAAELAGGESDEGRALSDAALFWSLAAAQSGAIQGLSELDADRELTQARVAAVRSLSSGDAGAQRELEACVARAPDLG
jgi:hypothetical protein